MENEIILEVLIIVATIAIVVIGAFLVRLLIDLSKLAQSAKTVSDTINTELEPTLQELKAASENLNMISGLASEQIQGVENAVKKVFCATSSISNKLGGLFQGLVKGVKFGIGLFRK